MRSCPSWTGSSRTRPRCWPARCRQSRVRRRMRSRHVLRLSRRSVHRLAVESGVARRCSSGLTRRALARPASSLVNASQTFGTLLRESYKLTYRTFKSNITSLYRGPTEADALANALRFHLGSFRRPSLLDHPRPLPDPASALASLYYCYYQFTTPAVPQNAVGHETAGHAARLTSRQASRYAIGA